MDTEYVPGPWIAESEVTCFEPDNGLAVIALLPELERTPDGTPTRGMVAWINSGIGACDTDAKAIATARLIAAAPDMLAALKEILAGALPYEDAYKVAKAALAKAGQPT